MAAFQRVEQSNVKAASSSSSYGSCKAAATASTIEKVVPDQFPVGLRVLVVDDDLATLRIIERMAQRCRYIDSLFDYTVTVCSEATVALNLLREKEGCFDVILSDVHMPDMDGYKLLEHVGLEMDLPVIMMSADGRTSAVMKGIKHGACDYLIKPLREEELKNIWQHVVRKKCNENKEHENSGSFDDSGRNKHVNDDAEYASPVTDATELVKVMKKRSSSKEDEDSMLENDDSSTSKKPRVVWSVELHQQFVTAVHQLGLDKAVPKRILELMNVPGLTRENVASHLQKFRLYLKRINGASQQQNGMSNTISGSLDSNVKLAGLGKFDVQALAAASQVPPQTLAALHAELLGHPAGYIVPTVDQSALMQASVQQPKLSPLEHGVAFGQPLAKCPSNVAKNFPQTLTGDDGSSGYGAWPTSNTVGTVGPDNDLGGMGAPNNNFLMDMLQHQQRQQQSVINDQSRSIKVQPSCLVVPSQSSGTFQACNNSASDNQNCGFDRTALTDYNLFSSQSNISSLNIAQFNDGNAKAGGVLQGYGVPNSISTPVSSSIICDNSNMQQLHNSSFTYGAVSHLPSLVPNVSGIQGSFGTNPGDALDQGHLRNLGFVGKGTYIPSRLAVHEIESSKSDLSQEKASVNRNFNIVKEEPNVDFVDNQMAGLPISQRYPSGDPN